MQCYEHRPCGQRRVIATCALGVLRGGRRSHERLYNYNAPVGTTDPSIAVCIRAVPVPSPVQDVQAYSVTGELHVGMCCVCGTSIRGTYIMLKAYAPCSRPKHCSES